MNEFTHARATLRALTDAHGVPELEAVLARLEKDLDTAVGAVQVAARSTDGLLEFHTALVHLRSALEPVREAIFAYENDVDALYWSRAATPAGTRIALDAIRTYKHLLADLIFCLPHYPRKPILPLPGNTLVEPGT